MKTSSRLLKTDMNKLRATQRGLRKIVRHFCKDLNENGIRENMTLSYQGQGQDIICHNDNLEWINNYQFDCDAEDELRRVLETYQDIYASQASTAYRNNQDTKHLWSKSDISEIASEIDLTTLDCTKRFFYKEW